MKRNLLADDATQPALRRGNTLIRALLWLLVLVLLLTIGLLVTIITTRPGTVGLIAIVDLQQTDNAVQFTVAALQATDQSNQQHDLDLQNTQAALNNFASRLSQIETQQAVNDQSTLTAVALANAAQATQAAVSFASTQAALQQIGTQIQQDFEATQTALSDSFATIEANRPPQHILLLEGDFIRGVETTQGQFLTSSAWALSDTGALIAQADNAVALTRLPVTNNAYTVNTRFTATPSAGNYYVIFGLIENAGGYVLRLSYDGTQIYNAALFAINASDLNQSGGIVVDEAAALNIASALVLPGNEITIEIRVDEAQVNASVNGLLLFTTQMPVTPLTGTAGIQLRTGAQLQILQVIPR
ncbi:MAG: hypothetical protein H7X77_01440 [Anaerolineae bacterium]|nr:hypothetical protein [Anaerolineae bacterium]